MAPDLISLDSAVPEKVIWPVAGDKGGIGKSSLTANIGVGLALLGHKVIIVDSKEVERLEDVLTSLFTRILRARVDAYGFVKNFGYCRLRRHFARNKKNPTDHRPLYRPVRAVSVPHQRSDQSDRRQAAQFRRRYPCSARRVLAQAHSQQSAQ